MKNYKKLWELHHGPIPFDSNGRKYHIHHIDGDNTHNDISNLICIPPQEHYNIHYLQGDYFSCYLIAKHHLKVSKHDLLEIAKLSGEQHKNTVTVKDTIGNYYRVPLSDPRYISGEFIGTTRGLVMARCTTTNEYIQIPISEFTLGKAAGLFVGVTSGKTLSQDHKDKLSTRNIGKKRSPEHKVNYAAGVLGRRLIVNIHTGERKFAYPTRKFSHQTVHTDITELSDWKYVVKTSKQS